MRPTILSTLPPDLSRVLLLAIAYPSLKSSLSRSSVAYPASARLARYRTGTLLWTGLDPEEASEPMKRNAPDARARVREEERHEDLPTWRKTRPRANPEVHRRDLDRSTERLEMLLGH